MTLNSYTFEQLVDDFEFLGEWEERYRHVIDLGRKLPAFDAAWRTAGNKVEGCVSQVWLKATVETGKDNVARLVFKGDSDALIVRGLIAILMILLSGRPVREIFEEDVESHLRRLGLDEHLTPQRSNGLRSMVRRIKSLAAEALTAQV